MVEFFDIKNHKQYSSEKIGIEVIKTNSEFVVTGNYNTFFQIFKGEISTLIALIKNRVKIKCDKAKALKLEKPIGKLNKCLREIETEY